MLEVFLKRTDTGEMAKPGSPRQFQHYAPDCDSPSPGAWPMNEDVTPHTNIGLERTVLGQMVGFHAYAAYVAAGLRREDFFRAVHRHVFDAVAAVEASGVVADLVTVGLELRKRGTLGEVGAVYFSGLVTEVLPPTAGAPEVLVAELGQLAAKRNLAAALVAAPLEELAARVDAALYRGPEERRTYDSIAQLDTIRQDITRDRVARIWLGFPTLDNIIEGLRPGEVLGLMARPGIGKTMVLGHIARAVAESEVGHVFFSLEMPAAQIVQRIACAHYGLNRYTLRDRLEANGLDATEYAENFRRFLLVDTPGLDVSRMAAKLRQIQAGPLKNVPIRLVTVDHLGLIGGDRKMSTYDRVSTQARELKELAKRFECAVVVAIQVNREAGGDGSKELGLGAARDSGVVEEAMDYLIAIRRLDRTQALGQVDRERHRDVLFAKVVKNRHGSPDTEIAIRLDPRTLRLEEDRHHGIAEDELGRIAASAGRRR
jgi:replicative DNA helicase